ncbi:MAG: PAS domain S-box protein [Gammaproteobacteria bacterium]|nr:PAS domain S-box protein [Gammaproteobacteria bacterium]
MSKTIDTGRDTVSSDQLSATIYLNKIKEFSEDTFSALTLNSDLILNQTFQFMREVLRMDCAFLGELLARGQTGKIRGMVEDRLFNEEVTGLRMEALSSLCEESNVFGADDDGDREIANILLNGYVAMSGISVPIECEGGPRGVLAVYSTDVKELSAAKILFVKSMASVISLFLQSQELLPNFDLKNARLVIEAKQILEGTVDSLNQLVVVLGEDGKIMRVNKAIQHWELGTIGSNIHETAENLINKITPAGIPETLFGWQEIWANLPQFGHIAWEASNVETGKMFRFSLRTISNKVPNVKVHKGFAVLVVEDITLSKHAEEKLKKYNTELEDTLKQRNIQLEELNRQLTCQLEEQKKNKIALLKSEAKYIQLFNNTLAAVCLLNGGRIQFCNDRFCQLFKYRNADLCNAVFVTLFNPEDRGKLLSLFADLEALDGKSTDIVILKGKDGLQNQLWLELKMEYLNAVSDNTIIVNIFDVTPQKNIELSLRRSEERLQKLSSQLLNTQENERKRLAMELHDGLGQSLSAIKYSMEDLIRDKNCNLDDKISEVLTKSITQIRQTVDDARRMAMDLRPSILDDLGIISTINWFCREFEETYKEIRIEKAIYLEENDISDNRKIVIYRILQEALNNVAKHAQADTVSIVLQKIDEFIGLSITDNGIGFRKSQDSLGSRGMGINSMQERVELSGGSFRIVDNVPRGTIISIRWPSVLVSGC